MGSTVSSRDREFPVLRERGFTSLLISIISHLLRVQFPTFPLSQLVRNRQLAHESIKLVQYRVMKGFNSFFLLLGLFDM